MLSQRRIKIIVIAVIAMVFLASYYSSESSSVQNQKFYRSTTAAMAARDDAKHAKTREKIQNAMHEADQYVVGGRARDQVERPAVPKAPVKEETEEISIAGRTKMTVPKRKDQDTLSKPESRRKDEDEDEDADEDEDEEEEDDDKDAERDRKRKGYYDEDEDDDDEEEDEDEDEDTKRYRKKKGSYDEEEDDDDDEEEEEEEERYRKKKGGYKDDEEDEDEDAKRYRKRKGRYDDEEDDDEEEEEKTYRRNKGAYEGKDELELEDEDQEELGEDDDWGEERKTKPNNLKAKRELNTLLKRYPVVIFSKSYCPYSKKAKSILLDQYTIVPKPYVVELDQNPIGPELQNVLKGRTGRRTVPNILVNGKSIGGGDDISELDENRELASTLRRLGGKRVTKARRQSG